jgi:hypothetical protein
MGGSSASPGSFGKINCSFGRPREKKSALRIDRIFVYITRWQCCPDDVLSTAERRLDPNHIVLRLFFRQRRVNNVS